MLVVYDSPASKRLELEICAGGYVTRGGAERLANGLRVLSVWGPADRGGRQVQHDLRAMGLVLEPTR